MNIEPGKSALIVVETDWSERKGIRRLLGATDSGRPVSADEHYIIARVIDQGDARGLWIELNTKRRFKDPTVPRRTMLIPWGAVLSILYDPDQPDPDDELTKLWTVGEDDAED